MANTGRKVNAFTITSLYSSLRGILLLTPWLTHLLIADILLSALLPFQAFFPNACYNIASQLAFGVWNSIQSIFTSWNKARITFSGATLPQLESAIVISNHVEWVDFYLIQSLALKAGMLGRCRWFAKQQLRYVPFLGWGLWAMGMPLVSRRWTQDRRELERVFRGVTERKWPMWLISYSEATRYTPKKYEESQVWCREHKKPCPQHALYPRTKGFIATVKELRKAPHMKAVYDVTIAYAKGHEFLRPPSFWNTVAIPNLAQQYRFHVHVERFELKELPESDEELATWLETRWVEKGERLEILRVALTKGEPWPPVKLLQNASQ